MEEKASSPRTHAAHSCFVPHLHHPLPPHLHRPTSKSHSLEPLALGDSALVPATAIDDGNAVSSHPLSPQSPLDPSLAPAPAPAPVAPAASSHHRQLTELSTASRVFNYLVSPLRRNKHKTTSFQFPVDNTKSNSPSPSPSPTHSRSRSHSPPSRSAADRRDEALPEESGVSASAASAASASASATSSSNEGRHQTRKSRSALFFAFVRREANPNKENVEGNSDNFEQEKEEKEKLAQQEQRLKEMKKKLNAKTLLARKSFEKASSTAAASSSSSSSTTTTAATTTANNTARRSITYRKLSDPLRQPRRLRSLSISTDLPQDFPSFLRSKLGFKYFLAHLKSEHSEENLLFWQAVERLRHLSSSSSKLEMAREIYHNFVRIGSLNEINISDMVRESISQRMAKYEVGDGEGEGVDVSLFDGAQREVMALMERDGMMRFRFSPLYLDYLTEVGNPSSLKEREVELDD